MTQALAPGELLVAVAGTEPVKTLLPAVVVQPGVWVRQPVQPIPDHMLLEPVAATVVAVARPWTVDGVRSAVVPVVLTTAELTR